MPTRKGDSGEILARFMALAGELRRTRTWRDNWDVLRHAVTALPLLERDPVELARDYRAACDELGSATRWWQTAHGSIRYVIAAAVLRHGDSVAEFLGELERVRKLFRAERLPRAPEAEVLAALILREDAAAGRGAGRVEASSIQRMVALYREVRRDHPWLLGAAEYPTLALLAASNEGASDTARRVESVLVDLERRRFARRGVLMPASQILFVSRERDDKACERFAGLWREFRARGLRMHSGDYDELALLAHLPLDPERVVSAVLADREPIRTLRPRPRGDLSFSLACSTAYLRLSDESPRARAVALTQMAVQVRSVLAAQQAAAAAAAG